MALELQKLRDSSRQELETEEKELRDQIWKLQLQRATGQAQDPNKVREVRKDLARVLTIKRELEQAQARGR